MGCARAKASVVMPCFFGFAKRDLAGRGCWARFVERIAGLEGETWEVNGLQRPGRKVRRSRGRGEMVRKRV